MKTLILAAVALAVYIALGGVAPVTGHTAIVFPTLALVPAIGTWLCFLTYKGVIALFAFSALSAKV